MLTASSSLKFMPEELVLYCRDFRVLHFRFPESGLEPGAFRVSLTLPHAPAAGRDPAAYVLWVRSSYSHVVGGKRQLGSVVTPSGGGRGLVSGAEGPDSWVLSL